jgi:hypothetical protein
MQQQPTGAAVQSWRGAPRASAERSNPTCSGPASYGLATTPAPCGAIHSLVMSCARKAHCAPSGVSWNANLDERRNLHQCRSVSKRPHNATNVLRTMLSTWAAGPQEDECLFPLGLWRCLHSSIFARRCGRASCS